MSFFRALQTTIGRKFLMAITGLLLCSFLVVHLAGNVFLFVGADAYNGYAHKLHSQEWLVKIAEAGLYSLFALHIYMAVVTTLQNRRARKNEYTLRGSKRKRRFSFFPENWMMISGVIVLGFMVLHVAEFSWNLRPGVSYGDDIEPFDKALAILTDPISIAVYLLGCIVLGFHLAHGVASAVQTLGANHKKLRRCVKWAGILFALVIAVGFGSFVVWANLGAPTLTGAAAEQTEEALEETVPPTGEDDALEDEGSTEDE